MDQTQVSVQIALETSRGVPGDGHAVAVPSQKSPCARDSARMFACVYVDGKFVCMFVVRMFVRTYVCMHV